MSATTLEGAPARTEATLTANALVTKLDELMGKMDENIVYNRELAKSIGELLPVIRKQEFNGQRPAFRVWFISRYKKTDQTAMKWMRLAKEWKNAETAWEKDTTPGKKAWERLSVDETLSYVSTPRKDKKKAEAVPSPEGDGSGEGSEDTEAEAGAGKVIRRTVKVPKGIRIKVGKETIIVDEQLLLIPE